MDEAALKSFCCLLDNHLETREKANGTVSLLASGGAFEQWLSFESRVVLESHRQLLGLDDEVWSANEHHKVDLSVWRGKERRPLAAIEFKLIHNNKNWKAQADRVWEDLFPAARSQKSKLNPRLRAALVCVIGKVYPNAKAANYLGQCTNLGKWRAHLWKYLVTTWNGSAVKSEWNGHSFSLEHPVLAQDRKDHFMQLHLLLPSGG